MPAAQNIIDITPTWTEALPMLFALMERGTTKEAREIAKEEIARMAKAADAYAETKKQLPEPPAIIKVNEDFSNGLDLRNPIHAKAYLKAASHFLSNWPQEWDAETLCLALLAEEEDDEQNLANQKKIFPWEAIQNSSCFATEGEYFFLEQIICYLAKDFIDFLKVSD
jgi:hypothetical protein